MCSYGLREHYEIVSTECQTSNESIGEIHKKTFPKWFEQNVSILLYI